MYGDRGDVFYILLKGVVSMWVPVPAEKLSAMVDLLKKEKQNCGDAEKFGQLNFECCAQDQNITRWWRQIVKEFPEVKKLDEPSQIKLRNSVKQAVFFKIVDQLQQHLLEDRKSFTKLFSNALINQQSDAKDSKGKESTTGLSESLANYFKREVRTRLKMEQIMKSLLQDLDLCNEGDANAIMP